LGRSSGLLWYETAVFDGGGYFGQNLDSETDVSSSIVFSSPFIFSKKMKLHFFNKKRMLLWVKQSLFVMYLTF
jgi:hypothetical protein